MVLLEMPVILCQHKKLAIILLGIFLLLSGT